jgi:VIT family
MPKDIVQVGPLQGGRIKLAEQPDAELRELTNIYVGRGLDLSLARQVAEALTAKDAFATHARDELGLSAHVVARPIQAALTSAVTFAFGAAIPLLIAIASPLTRIPWVVSGGSIVALAILGAVGAQTGGAGILRPMLRVTFWGGGCDGYYRRHRPPCRTLPLSECKDCQMAQSFGAGGQYCSPASISTNPSSLTHLKVGLASSTIVSVCCGEITC